MRWISWGAVGWLHQSLHPYPLSLLYPDAIHPTLAVQLNCSQSTSASPITHYCAIFAHNPCLTSQYHILTNKPVFYSTLSRPIESPPRPFLSHNTYPTNKTITKSPYPHKTPPPYLKQLQLLYYTITYQSELFEHEQQNVIASQLKFQTPNPWRTSESQSDSDSYLHNLVLICFTHLLFSTERFVSYLYSAMNRNEKKKYTVSTFVVINV